MWNGHWHFFYRDESGKPRRVRCDALDCHNKGQRARKVKVLRDLERHHDAERLRLGPLLDYSHDLHDAVTLYLTHTDARPDIEPSTKREAHKALDRFAAWISKRRPGLTTGGLDGPALGAFLNSLEIAPATANKYRRNLKAMVRWWDTVRPKLLPEIGHLMRALKQDEVQPRDAIAFTPAELGAMRNALDEDQRRLFTFLAVTGCRLSEAWR